MNDQLKEDIDIDSNIEHWTEVELSKSRGLSGAAETDVVTFRMFAYTALATQPENTSPIDERIIIAANEAYKKVIEIG